MKNNTNTTKFAALVVGVLFLVFNMLPVAFAATTGNTTASLATTALATELSITSSGSVTGAIASGITISAAGAAQTVGGSVASIAITDNRGNGSGWTVSVTANHLGIIGSSVKKRRSSGSVSTSSITINGVWSGMNVPASWSNAADALPPGEYKLEITTVNGNGNPASATLTEPDGGQSSITFNSGVAAYGASSLNSQLDGLSYVMTSGSYSIGDTYTFLVDAFSYNGLTLNSQAYSPDLDSTSSPPASTTGIAVTGSAALSGNYITASTSASRTDVAAELGEGLGTFFYGEDLQWVTHGAPIAGTYNSTLVYTIASL